jgi:hypothetical protein
MGEEQPAQLRRFRCRHHRARLRIPPRRIAGPGALFFEPALSLL